VKEVVKNSICVSSSECLLLEYLTCSGLLHLLLWKDSGPLQTLRNQFFRERLQIDIEACRATLVGPSASTCIMVAVGE
jgi:hypothetical protein